jgi:hypothetical protein
VPPPLATTRDRSRRLRDFLPGGLAGALGQGEGRAACICGGCGKTTSSAYATQAALERARQAGCARRRLSRAYALALTQGPREALRLRGASSITALRAVLRRRRHCAELHEARCSGV